MSKRLLQAKEAVRRAEWLYSQWRSQRTEREMEEAREWLRKIEQEARWEAEQEGEPDDAS